MTQPLEAERIASFIRKLLGLPPKTTQAMKAEGATWVKMRVPDCDGAPDFVWVEARDILLKEPEL